MDARVANLWNMVRDICEQGNLHALFRGEAHAAPRMAYAETAGTSEADKNTAAPDDMTVELIANI